MVPMGVGDAVQEEAVFLIWVVEVYWVVAEGILARVCFEEED